MSASLQWVEPPGAWYALVDTRHGRLQARLAGDADAADPAQVRAVERFVARLDGHLAEARRGLRIPWLYRPAALELVDGRVGVRFASVLTGKDGPLVVPGAAGAPR